MESCSPSNKRKPSKSKARVLRSMEENVDKVDVQDAIQNQRDVILDVDGLTNSMGENEWRL